MKQRWWMLSILLFSAGVICGAALDRSTVAWRKSSEAQDVIPNVDFSEMAIATRPVEATVSGGTAKVRVKAWERCALGFAICDKPRQRTVEAVCLGSATTVLIDEKDWPAFQRIHDEDLQGVEGLPMGMNLCDS
jgi:Flp pilus assembly protein CpaB